MERDVRRILLETTAAAALAAGVVLATAGPVRSEPLKSSVIPKPIPMAEDQGDVSNSARLYLIGLPLVGVTAVVLGGIIYLLSSETEPRVEEKKPQEETSENNN